MRKNKILVVGPLPPPYNGMSVVTEDIISSQILNDNFQLIHLDTSDKRSVDNIGQFDFVNIYLAFKHFFNFIWLCMTYNPDIVYIPIAQNFLGYLRDSLFLFPASLFKNRTIIHLHGGYFQDFYLNSNFFMKFIIRLTQKKISKAIVLGECFRNLFSNIIPDSKVVVVPNGIIDDFPKLQKQFSKDTIEILFLSNLCKEKGIFDFVQIIPPLVKKYSNIKFTCVGEWMNSNEQKEILRFTDDNKIESHINFTGRVSDKEKILILEKSDIFVMPTKYLFEGQPRVILEAMAAFIPVVATGKGCIKETIINGETGFIIEPEDINSLIEKVSILITNDDLRKKFGLNARKRFLDSYTEKYFHRKLLGVFLT